MSTRPRHDAITHTAENASPIPRRKSLYGGSESRKKVLKDAVKMDALRPAGAATLELNRVNNTLHAFMGGKHKSWMANPSALGGASGRATVRPQQGPIFYRKTPKSPPAVTIVQSPMDVLPRATAVSSADSERRSPLSHVDDQAAQNNEIHISEALLPSPAPSNSPPVIEHRELEVVLSGHDNGHPQTTPSEVSTPLRPGQSPDKLVPERTELTTRSTEGQVDFLQGAVGDDEADSPSRKRIYDGNENPRASKRRASNPSMPISSNGEQSSNTSIPVSPSRSEASAILPQNLVDSWSIRNGTDELASDPITPRNHNEEYAPVSEPCSRASARCRSLSVQPLPSPREVSSPALILRSDYQTPDSSPRGTPGLHSRATPVPTSVSSINPQVLASSPQIRQQPMQYQLGLQLLPGHSQNGRARRLSVSRSAEEHQVLQQKQAQNRSQILLRSHEHFKTKEADKPFTSLETARLNVLCEAIERDDWFFMLIHQAYCAREVFEAELCEKTGLTSAHLAGFDAVKLVLDDNSNISLRCLKHFGSFPAPLSSELIHQPLCTENMAKIKRFLLEGNRQMSALKRECVQNGLHPTHQMIKGKLGTGSWTFDSLVTSFIVRQINSTAGATSNARMPGHTQWAQHPPHSPRNSSPRLPTSHGRYPFRASVQTQLPSQALAHASLSPTMSTAFSVVQGAVASQPVRLPADQGHREETRQTPLVARNLASLTFDSSISSGDRLLLNGVAPPIPQTTFQGTLPSQRMVHQFLDRRQTMPPGSVSSSRMPMPIGYQQQQQYPHRSGQPPSFTSVLPPPTQQSSQLSPQQTGGGQGYLYPEIPANILQNGLASPTMSPEKFSEEEGSVPCKLYLAVVDFAMQCFFVKDVLDKRFFVISDEQERRLSRMVPPKQANGPWARSMVKPGDLIYRLRCIEIAPGGQNPQTESDWIVRDTKWPKNIFVEINGKRVDLRRKATWGKDMSTDITTWLKAGENELKVIRIISSQERRSDEPQYLMCVEIFQCSNEDDLKQRMLTDRGLTASEAKTRILTKLIRSGDDEISVETDTVTIDVFCPLSMRLWELPVRGRNCKHLEAFDWNDFMHSRPRKRGQEPPSSESYRCPLCKADARPSQLFVDGFLLDVQARLKARGLESTRSIVVSKDGSWTPKREKSKDSTPEIKGETEIICLDD